MDMSLWRRMRGLLLHEHALLHALPRNARVLLGTSSIFAFAMPVINIFVSAFIMRNSQDVVKVMVFQLASYTGVPITFYVNGLLLRRFNASTLYGAGMALSGCVLFVLTSLSALELSGILVTGLTMGVAIGFHWANRNLLALSNTRDIFRNYYFAIEGFFFCVSGVVVPAAVGAFISWSGTGVGPDAGANLAYRTVAGGAMLLALAATWMVSRGDFPRVPAPVAIALRFDRIWCGLLALSVFKGVVHVFQSVLPVMLVMQLLGDREHVLGAIQSVGALIAAGLVYVVGRNTRPCHRLGVFGVALGIYALGAGRNACWFAPWSVLFFVVCFLVSQPLSELAYSPIQLLVMDRAVRRDASCGYAYLCGYEMGLYAGRLFGGSVFIAVALFFSGELALRYVLIALALLQLVSIPVARAVVSALRADDFEVERRS
jgi:YQGE family putative transporter